MATTPTSNSPSSDSTAPSTPPSTASSIVNAAKPSERCTSPSCPINHPHDRGFYIYSCRVPLGSESSRIFAPSVPPPDVLAAYERCIRHEGTRTDEEIWATFHELHVEPLLEHTDAVWVAPVPMRMRDDDLDIDNPTNSSSVEVDGRADVCRHPFGPVNPPEIVWEAHRRLVLGVEDSWDQEVVDAFKVENAYYGNGLGQHTSVSRGFEVRRPRYSAKLAKQRRIKRKLETERNKRLNI